MDDAGGRRRPGAGLTGRGQPTSDIPRGILDTVGVEVTALHCDIVVGTKPFDQAAFVAPQTTGWTISPVNNPRSSSSKWLHAVKPAGESLVMPPRRLTPAGSP